MMSGMAKKPDTRWTEAKQAGEKPGRDADGVSLRSFKVHDDIWMQAKSRAGADGVPVSEVVRRALISYLGLPEETPGVVGRKDR